MLMFEMRYGQHIKLVDGTIYYSIKVVFPMEHWSIHPIIGTDEILYEVY